ncbi:unnamed protein product [Zymoseptoria tritici ST99CH_3D1]|uniref:Uncharacterized protein n=1 Tax=Zymoseptoria tritici ST99CH_1E4 TaxID=1276532 RepID=A0A2H1HBT0_ZYMTR|nr:unnamed protein product [Zymoseptoria tritici ST99CH_1E4]SMR65208.1 unnamed protein product [Zymoseptoria tritici ST99CH_3D1]
MKADTISRIVNVQIQELRTHVGCTLSRTVDLNQVSERLQAASPTPSIAITVSPSSEEEQESESLRTFSAPPKSCYRYRNIILFWQLSSTGRINFCGRQLSRWKKFRGLQCIIRSRTVTTGAVLVRASYFDTWEEFLHHPASRGWSGS